MELRKCMDPNDPVCHHNCEVGQTCAKFAEQVEKAPYPFCNQPWTCAGTGRCQQTPCCAD